MDRKVSSYQSPAVVCTTEYGLKTGLSSLNFGIDPDVKLVQDVGRFYILPTSLGTGFSSSGARHRNNGERG